ncbi:Hypothetical_protein [Hexamita inflata]|uniref:Hypothetical_protein n=1 Tax=Hexamita inflata TaxID=28002 RepID=A0AA86TFG9_9EUKA|nr:Hypothetical protein HINF_LOCUS3885 [Hexamita inflata]
MNRSSFQSEWLSAFVSGWSSSDCGTDRRYRRNWFQVDFEKLEIDFTIFVCLDRWISRKKAKLLYDIGGELDNTNRLGQMNEQVLTRLLELLETELTCLFTRLCLHGSSVSHSLPRVRINGHQSDSLDFILFCLHFVQTT